MKYPQQYDVAIIGAGVAGLAAASALSRAGGSVVLLDRKPFVGGRAYSYLHPALNEVVDSQHILVGCCTNLRHLCEQAGIAEQIRWYDRYSFLEPGGRRSDLALSALPAPLHTAPSFAAASMLSLTDKVGIAKALISFLRGYPSTDHQSVTDWLHGTRQSERAIRHFWEPILVGALNDGFDRCSMRYAGQVFHETFLRSAEGGRFGIPTLPLSDFYAPVARQCEANGASLLLKGRVTALQQKADGWSIHLDSEEQLQARTVICAVSFEHLELLLGSELTAQVLPCGTDEFTHSPITTVHLWFDREFTDLEHAVLLDSGIQWMFQKSRIRRWSPERGAYLELTISASHAELRQGRDALIKTSLRELEGFFPIVRSVTLRKAAVFKEAKATFSVTPGLDAARPSQETTVPGFVLAGDWTATGWPSTMEGGVRSGYLAAEVVMRQLNTPRSFVQPDLPPAGLMRWLARK